MIELVFVACLMGAPDRCVERSLQFAENITPMACLMGAQPQLAAWNESHPNWRVARWSCRAPGRREQPV